MGDLNGASRCARGTVSALLRASASMLCVAAALLSSATVFAEGSRSLYPSSYTATPTTCTATTNCRADLDLTGGANQYLGIIPRRTFIYVYAQTNEFILVGSRNRTNGGDVSIYNPQSFGTKGNETIPGAANFTCAGVAPVGSFSGGTLGQITTRAVELAGPNSADNTVTVTNGFAPCAYKAPSTGVYGVLFSVATSGGAAPTGIIDPPSLGNASVSAWDVTVRATQTSITDLNTRAFTYAWVGFSNGNPRPISHTLYYVTLDGSRYSQLLRGLDPNAYALFGNNAGFLDSGQPLYKDVRGTNQTVTTLNANEANIKPQNPQAPVFFSTPDPLGANATETDRVLAALGIPTTVTLPNLSAVSFTGAQSGNQTYVNAGGTFKFTTANAVSYQIVISIDGVNFDPGSATNATLAGFAPDGVNSIIWNGRNNNNVAFPAGTYTFQIFARNGEIHFPIVDTEGNANGGPTLTKLNGTPGDHTVFYDDRGYLTRSALTVGTLNGNLCVTANPVPPLPDHSLLGVDSSAKNVACTSASDASGQCYYRSWPGNGNANTDCSNTVGEAFGDAKAIDLWSYQQATVPNPTIVINPQPTVATISTTVSVPPTTFPSQQVFGSFQFENVSTANATGMTYSVVIGTPGNCPTALAFTFPTNQTFTYNAATCVVTLTNNNPATLNASTQLNYNFSYTAPATGTIPVTTTITSTNATTATASGTTVVVAANVAATVSVPATAAGGSTVSGTVTFSNLGSATTDADGVTYTMSIGTAGSCPTGVTFPVLPGGVTASFNSTTCQVSFTGMPTTLTAGQTLNVGFQYTGPATGSVIVNAAIATTTPEGGATANNSATGTTTFSSADLSITKTDGVTTATPGTSVTYAIVASNAAGPNAVTGATVTDNFPAAISSATWTCAGTGGGTCPASGSGNINATVNLPVGGSVTFTVTANISPSATGTLNNTATVTVPVGVSDPTPGNNSATDSDTLNPSADLSITKTDGVATATPGGSVTYTIVATNSGPSAVTAATVADTFPASLTATWTCAGTGGGTCPASGSGNINASVNLPVGATVVFTVTANINASATGTLSNTATVTPPAGVTDPTPGNNTATDTDTLNPSADLSITKTDGVTTATAGGSVTYTITASNAGPSAVTGATVADTFPAAITSANWTCVGAGGGTCTASGSGNINTSVNLPVGASVTFTVTATISMSATGTLSNTATVTPPAGVSDPVPGNNSATDSDTINGSADLSITKTDGVTTATPGGTVTYTITASNAGPTLATGAIIADTFPVAITSATWTCSGTGGGTCPASGSGNINTTVNLPSGSSVTFIVTATISPSATGTLSNTATVTPPAGVTDPTPGNNSATDSDTLNPSADLSITKTDGVASATPGGSVTYTVVATNNGPSAAPGTKIVDAFPASITSDSWTATATGGATGFSATGTGNINDTVNMPVGSSVTYIVTANISQSATGTLTNTATVTTGAGVTDPTLGNNSATDTDTLNPSADLSILKNDSVTSVTAGGTVTYTILVSNAGPSAANGAIFQDPAVANFTATAVVCALPTGGAACPGASTVVAMQSTGIIIPTLPSGGSVTFTLTGTAGASGSIVNTATIAAPAGVTDPTSINNSSTDTDTINPSADLSITKTDGVTTATAGGSVTYTIVASNAGPSAAPGTKIVDTFPAAISSDNWTATATGGATGFSASGSGNINDTVNMPVGSTVTYVVTANISMSATGTLSNTATVTPGATVADPTPGNNTATDSDTLGGSADLSITKTDGVATATPGGTVTYTITASNAGPTLATGAIIADTFPATITSATWTCTGTGGGTCPASGSGNINATVNLPSGSSVTFIVTANISASATGTLVNTATVTPPAGVTDPTPGNNSATDTDTLNPSADLSINKTDGTTSYTPGSTTTYTIVATNNGPSAVTGATITDTFGASFTSDSWTAVASGGATGFSATGTGNINDTVNMPVGSSITYTVNATISLAATGNVSNTATIAVPAGVTDPAPGNNSATDTDSNGGAQQLSIVKSATPGAFAVGQSGTYSLVVSNTGTTSTAGAINVSDTLPAGITSSATPSGAGWNCSASTATTVSCTTAAVLLPGGNAPVINVPITVAAGTASPAVNTATVSGGGDASCPAAAHCSSTISTPVNAPLIDVAKSLQGSLVVGVQTNYIITATNNGQAATLAGTITDTIPTGLTIGTLPGGCSAVGQNLTCTLPAGIPTGGSISYTIPVTPQASVSGSNVSNTATDNGGGDPSCPAAAHCNGTVTNTVTAPQLSLTKSASPTTFVVNQPATYTLTLTNVGTAATTATVTITDTIPGGLTIGTLPAACSVAGQTVTCTVPAPLNTGAPVSFNIPVTPTNALNGSSVTNTAGATGGGDPGCATGTPIGSLPARCVGTVTDSVNAPQLTIQKTASGASFVVGVAASYTLQVTNTGSAATNASSTITDVIPNSLTIGTLPAGCSATGQQITCTIASGLATGSSVSFVIPVTPTASALPSVSNTASVQGGGDPTCPTTANCSSTVTTPVNAPQLTIVKTASASNFVVGVAASYTLQVTNTGTAATTAAATVSDNVPGPLTIGTLPAGCSAAGQTVTCTIAAGLATGNSVSFVIPVTPTAAASGSTLSNTATVSGGGDPTCPGGANCTSTTTTPVAAPALQIIKTASASNFVVGVAASYTLQVTNTGTAATTATTTVSDNIPGSLTIGTLPAGCSAAGQTVTCTIAAGLPTGSPVSFVIPVTPTAAAIGTTLTNTATVSGGGDPTCPAGAACSSTTTTPVNAPALQVVKTASASNFVVGVAASYTLQVTNTGTAATTAATTISDNVPGTLTIGALPAGCSASGQLVTCTIAAGLPTGSPVSFVITVTPTAAASGTTLTNTATVSGGGDPTCPAGANCSSTTTTPVSAPALQIIKTASGASFVVGVPASYTLQVTNVGSAATTAVTTVTDNIPGTLTIGTLPAGCTAAGQSVTCTIAAGLATNSPVSFVIPVTPTAAASGSTVTNIATVSGGGDPTCPGGSSCSSTVDTPVSAPQLQLVKSASSTNFTVGVPASYTLTVTNVGNAATTATATVTDNIPGPLTIGTLPAGCSASGQSVTCTIAAGFGIGATVTFVIPVTAAAAASGSTLSNTATVSGGGDPACPNAANCSSTVTNPVDAPQLQVVKTASASNFVVGVAASYTLQVTNIGSAATTAVATITDNIPGTLTIGTLPAGCNASGQTVTCTIAAGLTTNTPVSFIIPVTATAAASGSTLTNTATVSGGGDPTCPGGTNCSSTVITPVNAPQLQVVKSASGTAFTVGVAGSYTLTVTNIGSAATTAVSTVTDSIPGTLTIGTLPAGCTASGQSVTCTIAAGLATNAPVSFVIPVTPTAAASGSTLTNTATVSGGGDPTCPNAPNCTSTVTTPVDQPALRVVKTSSATNFVVGTPASYTLTVTNVGSAATTAIATINDNIPATLTIGTLPAGCTAAGQVVTCSIAAGLATGTPVSFVIPVTPTAAASGTTLTNTATVSGGGDPSCPNVNNPNCSSTVTTPVDAPALQIVKTASSASFTVGVAASYTLTVTNIGGAATTAAATISDNVPGTLSIGGLPAGCTASGQTVTCAIAAGLAAGNSVSFVIPVTPTAAGAGTTVSNSATVSGGGDPACPAGTNCTSTTTTPVGAPQLQIVKTASSPTFAIGVPASYTLTVTNTGSLATTSTTTVTDNIPGTLTLGTLPAGCSATGQQVTCTIATGLAPNTPVTFTIPVTPTAASAGATLTNTAIVSGGGDPTCPAGPNCSSTVDTPVPVGATSSDLRIVKTGPASVTAGQNVVYTISVTNTGPDTAINAVLSDPPPPGLTFVSSGAPCAAFPCNLGNIALNQTVTIPNVTFHVPTGYAATSVINTASVTSATPDPTPNNNSSSVSTLVTAAGPTPVVAAPIDARWMLALMIALLAGAGARRARVRLRVRR